MINASPAQPPPRKSPDWAALVIRARAGEHAAWQELFALTRPWALARLAGRVRDHHAREDLAQEVMITLCRRLDALREPERFAGWFSTLVDNAAHAWGRRRQAQLRLEEAWQTHAPSESTPTLVPGEDADESARRARLTAAFHALSLEHQAVVRSRYVDGHGYTQTARQLGLDEGRVRGRLQKARQQLKLNLHPNVNLSTESYELTAADLTKLRSLTGITRRGDAPDSRFGVLAGLCLTPGGRVFATDGRRLAVHRIEALSGLTRRLVIGPAISPDFIPGIDGGRLTPELSACALEDAAGRRHEMPLFTLCEYPPAENVLDVTWWAGWRIKVQSLRAALAAVSPFLAPAHPLTASGQTYTPLLRLRLTIGSPALLIETDKLLGYGEAQEAVAAALAAQPGWRHVVEVQAEAAEGEAGEPERIVGFNAELLSGLLDALALAPDAELWLRIQEKPDTALGLHGVADPATQGQLMPVRLS